MVDWKDKIAVVTGASSGIGSATARCLAGEGMQVVLVSRSLDRLEKLAAEIRQAGGKAYVIATDLTHEAGRSQVFEEVADRFQHADVLVNNAGMGWYGYGNEMPWKTAWEILQVNIEAVVQLTLRFLGDMRERDTGHIINIGSISGSFPSQGVALYGATKSFLDNFTTALFRELTGTRVHISVVRAGAVRTGFGKAALALDNGGHVPTENIGIPAETVAKRVWGLLRRPRRMIYVPTYLRVVPWVELSFGWVIDRLGPLLLKRNHV